MLEDFDTLPPVKCHFVRPSWKNNNLRFIRKMGLMGSTSLFVLSPDLPLSVAYYQLFGFRY